VSAELAENKKWSLRNTRKRPKTMSRFISNPLAAYRWQYDKYEADCEMIEKVIHEITTRKSELEARLEC